jgi:hypothetical protein
MCNVLIEFLIQVARLLEMCMSDTYSIFQVDKHLKI